MSCVTSSVDNTSIYTVSSLTRPSHVIFKQIHVLEPYAFHRAAPLRMVAHQKLHGGALEAQFPRVQG